MIAAASPAAVFFLVIAIASGLAGFLTMIGTMVAAVEDEFWPRPALAAIALVLICAGSTAASVGLS